LLAGLFMGLCLLAVLRTAAAQTPTPTPDQIRMFQSLPPEQQRALMRQFGIDAPLEDGVEQPDAALTTPEVNRPKPFEQTAVERLLRPGVEQPPKIEGGDTVLLELTQPADPTGRPEIAGSAQIRERAMAG